MNCLIATTMRTPAYLITGNVAWPGDVMVKPNTKQIYCSPNARES